MFRSTAALSVLAGAMACLPAFALADRAEPLPPALEGVDLIERLGGSVPLDHPFTDSTGATVRLAELLEPGLPVILTFNYSDCPMLCSVQLSGLVDTLNKMSWRAGKQFRIVTISLDPNETPARAQETREMYLGRLTAKIEPSGWVFLTSGGDDTGTRAVAQSVGFGYRYFSDRKEYLHPAALMLLSADGRVSSYQYGVSYDPDELVAGLTVAGVGGTRESAQRFLLSCFHYDSPGGTARTAQSVMRWVGISFAASLALGLAVAGYRRS